MNVVTTFSTKGKTEASSAEQFRITRATYCIADVSQAEGVKRFEVCRGPVILTAGSGETGVAERRAVSTPLTGYAVVSGKTRQPGETGI